MFSFSSDDCVGSRKFLLLLITVGFVCFVFACEEKRYAYDPCARDNDCKAGHICRGGRCEKADLACQTNADCVGGRLCIQSKCQHTFCKENRDCASDEICRVGTCQPYGEKTRQTDAGPSEQRTRESEEKGDGQKDKRPPTFCTPNSDGQIERSELVPKVGVTILYRGFIGSSTPVKVDLKGSLGTGGQRIWDFSKLIPDSKKVSENSLSIKGSWYEKDFSSATHASILDPVSRLLSVFQATDQALFMQGVVSEEKNVTKVLYDKPIALFQFPLKVGRQWTSNGTLTGTLSSIKFLRMDEKYAFEVDAKGTLKTALGSFPVLRLKLQLAQAQYSPTSFRRTGITHYFLSECYGVVARVDSQVNETNPLFSQAAQVKLLSD